ncbi:MAG: PIN domain-containing protein [Novosphingobium sp.]|nr:PIN domain-containing protein [Novosphingobium sp.]
MLVDTNVWSELTKPAPDPRVRQWLIEHDRALWLSVLVIAEIRRGLEMPKARPRRDSLLRWLNGLEATYTSRILSFDADAAHLFGALLARRQGEASLIDLQLAAQAMAADMPIATRNGKDFAWTGAQLIDPWNA